MSRPDLDAIIQSPEAEAFLRMVTKGFYSNSCIGLWMYEVIGREWDEMREWAEGLRSEIHPQTCTWSIAIWEWVYEFEPDESMTLEERRQRIFSKILWVRPVNPEALRRSVAAFLGAADNQVEINDSSRPYSFEVLLHMSGEKPVNFENIFAYVRKIKPAHLAMYLTNSHENEPAAIELRITPFLAKPMGITTLPEIEPDFPGMMIRVTPVLQSITETRLPELEGF